jgi:hypothetical protein
MRGICIQNIAVGLLVPLGSWAANRPGPDVPVKPTLRMSVMVFDRAEVPDSILGEARERAGVILGKAGVEVEWIDCQRPPIPLVCEKAAELDRLLLTIVTEDSRRFFADDVLGRSVPGDGRNRGVYARVFYRHIRAKAEQEGVNAAQFLGLAVAHEFGHLLLGPQAHSPEGIMRANWSRHDMESGAKGQLRFTDRQALLSRADVQSRIKAAAGISVSAKRLMPTIKLTYEYKLDYAGTEWQPLLDRRTTQFANLAPGSYCLLVRAVSPNSGHESPAAAWRPRSP